MVVILRTIMLQHPEYPCREAQLVVESSVIDNHTHSGFDNILLQETLMCVVAWRRRTNQKVYFMYVQSNTLLS